MGAAAAAAKWSNPFSTPDSRADRQIRIRYGKVIRARSTASWNLPGSSVKPGASTCMIAGMNTSPSTVSPSSQNASTLTACCANPRAAAWPSVASRPVNSGTKAALNAPSPNRRRNMLGNLLATRNASATPPVPAKAAISMSRAKPSRRDAMVQPPTVRMPRNMREGLARIGRGWELASAPRSARMAA